MRMFSWSRLLRLLPLLVGSTSGVSNCPINGPVFANPIHLTRDPVLSHELSKLRSSLNQAVETNTKGLLNTTSYSVVVFSTEDETPVFEWHHSPAYLKNNKHGVHQVDSDTIYRVASVSKLITVYMLLAEIGDTHWNRPLVDILPELKEQAHLNDEDPIRYTDWDEVRLGDLAAHMAGIVSDCKYPPDARYSLNSRLTSKTVQSFGDLAVLTKNPTEVGFPPVIPSELPPCVGNTTTPCTRAEYLAAFKTRGPVYQPGTTPVYSSSSFALLGLALESLTGKSYSDIFEARLRQPLGLTSTYYHEPPDGAARGVIPNDDPAGSAWTYDLAHISPAGSFYSTPADLARLGRSILGSHLLSPRTTREWLKPVVHASDYMSVGRPWEIVRLPLTGTPLYPDGDRATRTVEAYTKTGDLLAYHARLDLLPEYGVGVAILVAGLTPEGAQSESQEEIGIAVRDGLVPALERTARAQAAARFGGTYEPRGQSPLNSSLVLTVADGLPGLHIQRWISNGTDFPPVLGGQFGMQLYPTNVEQVAERADGQKITRMAFRATLAMDPAFPLAQDPYAACNTWFGVDRRTYLNRAADELIFDVDENGDALDVEIPFLKITLARTAGT